MFIIRLDDLAKKLDAQLYGKGDGYVTGIASIEKAKPHHITFLIEKRFRKKLLNCKALAVILTKENLPFCMSTALVVKNPYLSYAKLAKLIDNRFKPSKNISDTAKISVKAKIGNGVSIGENCVIESGVILKDEVIIGSGCFIGKNSFIDEKTCLWANVTIHHDIIIGKSCIIQSNSVIGSDGFGYAQDEEKWIKIPQLGRVIIGNTVEIGSCTTIDRGSIDDTIIGNNVIIDNQCQIAHNVIIGDSTAVAGGVIMAGSLTVGKCCMIGGGSVINGHINICDKAIVTGMSMVMRSINEPGIYSSGVPLQKNKEWRKMAVFIMNLSNIRKKIKEIEQKIKKSN